MSRFLFALLFTIFIVQTWASPVKHRKRSFKVHRVENPNFVPDGKRAMKRAYLKFGVGDIAFKPDGEAAAEIRTATTVYANANGGSTPGTEDGEVPVVATQNDAQFLAPVKVGGQEMILNFDSGSADMWIFNTNLPPSNRTGHTIYDPSKSPTFKAFPNQKFDITYGDGSFTSGPVGFDQVDIGGSTVDQQAIGLPSITSASFVSDTASNGLVGLAFSTLNTVQPTPQKTFFDNIVNDLTLPLFTAQLKGGTVGAYEFGRIDDTAFVGDLVHVDIDSSRGFWEFDSTTAVVGNTTIPIRNGKAIADTGTSLILVPDELFDAYWSSVEGSVKSQDGAIFPCDAALPDLQLAVGPSYMATIPGEFMNFSSAGSRRGQKMCFGGLQSSTQLGLNFAIFGDVWFKTQYVVFQATGPSLGIAPHS